MSRTEVFETHTAEYEEWFEYHKEVFESEVAALREMLPEGDSRGIEVGLGSGHFTIALGIKEGIEPAEAMRNLALEKGIEVLNATAENLPYKDLHFDFVLMAACISYFTDVKRALKEANRVLKNGGSIIIGFIEKNSLIGKQYEEKRKDSIFYKQAHFYKTENLVQLLKEEGFHQFEFRQTLFENLNEIKKMQASKTGYDQGSFIVVKAIKRNTNRNTIS